MRDVRVGDMIVTPFGVETVLYFIHRHEHTYAEYIDIDIDSGDTLSISARHLLPVLVDCRQPNTFIDTHQLYADHAVFAQRITVCPYTTVVDMHALD